MRSRLVLLMTLTFSIKVSQENIHVGGNFLNRGIEKGMAYAKFKAHRFAFLNVTTIGPNNVVKAGSECGLACVNSLSCLSFNLAVFHGMNGKLLCQLLPTDIYNNSDKFAISEQFHHYSISSPCISWPCQNNGTCAAQYKDDSYICICKRGYTGKHCEILELLSVTICERNTQSISCGSGSTLDILEATFGRQNSRTCPGVFYTTNCIAVNSSSVVRHKCQAKDSCLLGALNSWFGDPCPGSLKYLFVKYRCI
nr:L-rhamnose-binding lectin CSL2-like [Pocillopora verrucosa]